MRTISCSGRGGGVYPRGCLPTGGGCLPRGGGVCPGGVCQGGVYVLGQTPPPPVHRILDARFWNHYLGMLPSEFYERQTPEDVPVDLLQRVVM